MDEEDYEQVDFTTVLSPPPTTTTTPTTLTPFTPTASPPELRRDDTQILDEAQGLFVSPTTPANPTYTPTPRDRVTAALFSTPTSNTTTTTPAYDPTDPFIPTYSTTTLPTPREPPHRTRSHRLSHLPIPTATTTR